MAFHSGTNLGVSGGIVHDNHNVFMTPGGFWEGPYEVHVNSLERDANDAEWNERAGEGFCGRVHCHCRQKAQISVSILGQRNRSFNFSMVFLAPQVPADWLSVGRVFDLGTTIRSTS